LETLLAPTSLIMLACVLRASQAGSACCVREMAIAVCEIAVGFWKASKSGCDQGRRSMAVHEIMVAEPHSCRRGFFRHLYARVETHHTGQYWTWWQVDERGIPLTDAERGFRTEDAALNDAVERLNGVSLVV
jgi:hypothetical protein